MADIHDTDSGPERKHHFMREKIAKPPFTKGQMVRRMIALLFIAVLFGAAAGSSYALVRPLADKYLYPAEAQETIAITIPKDEPESTEPIPETSEVLESTGETQPIEELLQNAMSQYRYSVSDLATLHGNLRSISQEAEKGIVEVHSVKQDVDWFNNPVENTGVYAGIVLSITPQEVLILTPVKAVENVDSIKVTFAGVTEVQGTIKQTDNVIGMAIVRVDHTLLDDIVLENIKAIQLANSYSVKQGDLIIAVGGPAGLVHSTCYGEISYIARNYPRIDGISRIFYTDIESNTDIGTFLLNLDGQVIGWVTNVYQDQIDSKLPLAIAVSEYKGILERLSNGIEAPYLGIRGQEISSEVAEAGVPIGIYVTDAVGDGPAYNAGIQNGDIITKIAEQNIASMKDFQVAVENLNAGDQVMITVQRNGVNEYKELEYQVTIGKR